MTIKKIDRLTCDFSGCSAHDDNGGKNWMAVRTLNKDAEFTTDDPKEQHICPAHDKKTFAEVIVGLKIDPKRMIGQL